jgi:nucleoside-triphosphatase
MGTGVKASCVICAWREGCQKKYSIVNPAMCPDFSRDLSIKGIAGVKGQKLLIEGAYGAGKSKLMDRVITRLGGKLKIGGFYTRDIFENGEKVGVRIITVDKKEGLLAHKNSDSRVKVNGLGVNLEDIANIAVPAIERAIHEGGVVMIDEIGRMELYSKRFREAVELAMDSDNPVIATVQTEGAAYAAGLKERPSIRVLHLDLTNRDDVLDMAVRILSES